jgi:uncharacterized phage protein gp47/JayE
MPFKVPSLADTRDFLVALGKSLFPWANYGSRRTFHGRRATYLAAAVTQIHAHVDSAQRDVHPLTAGDGKPIRDWGETVGVPPKEATPARKAAAGRVRGSAGATVSIGEQLKHDTSGLLYELSQNVTIPGTAGVDPDSFVDAGIVAVSTGAQTRQDAGQTLAFVNTLPGIERNVILQLALDEDGFDAEPFGSYRARVLATFSQTPSGGNQADFVKWALASLNTVAAAFAYPNRAGRGTIDIAAFYAGSGTARTLTVDDREAVAAYIRTQTTAPFQITGTGGGLRILVTVADPQPVEILLIPNGQAAFAFDWDDSTPPTVIGWDATARELQFSGGALPPSLRAGHRLSLRGVASAQDGTEFKIESISAVDKVILEKSPAIDPVATDVIYSGGPLVTPVRAAIVAHLNGEIVYAGRGLTPLPASSVDSTVGLDILAEGIGSANPGGIYNVAGGVSWSGAIVRAQLFGIAKYKAGVRDVDVVTPAANYEAVDDAFPDDGQIHYVTPGAVLVRRG